jgi:hypothetical protein
MKRPSRSFLLPFSLTAVALVAAMHLGIPKVAITPAGASDTCPNTECHGWQMCRYSPGVICALSSRTGPCTAWQCQ